MIKCAIFDADGTLIDSMSMWREITYEYAAYKGIDAPQGLHQTLNRLSMEQCADYYQSLGASGSKAQILEELAAWALKGYRERVGEKPHARDFVKLLHENGIQTAVATASHLEGVRAALEHTGILPYVDYITSCTEVGKSKEQPDVFLACASRFGASPKESVVFEDSAYALRTAREAGFPTVAVEDNISGCGGVPQETRLGLRNLSDRYIADYGELIRELNPPEDDFGGALAQSLQRGTGPEFSERKR